MPATGGVQSTQFTVAPPQHLLYFFPDHAGAQIVSPDLGSIAFPFAPEGRAPIGFALRPEILIGNQTVPPPCVSQMRGFEKRYALFSKP